MVSDELSGKISELVDILRSREGQGTSLGDIAGVSEVLIRTMQAFFSSVDSNIYQEVRELSEVINKARQDVALLRPKKMTSERLPRAGQELEAITKSTEEATNTIMEAAEEIMAGDVSDPDAYQTMVNDACMRIFEACSFQDITGQRVTKVVNTLTFIEERLDNLNKTWATDHPEDSLEETDIDRKDGEYLLNGPQLEGEGVDQDDIDALLAGETPAEIEAKLEEIAAKKAEAEKKREKEKKKDKKPSAAAPVEDAEPGEQSSQDDIDALFD